MASSISAGLCFKLTPHSFTHKTSPSLFSHPTTHLRVAHEVPPATLSNPTATNDGVRASSALALEKDPRELWKRYVDWLYQHKELGLYLDVSRVGFSDDFFREMDPRIQKAFKDMEELERGAIANPDEGRMVGHYWLRNPKLAPRAILAQQIETTLEKISQFADQVISGKVSCFSLIHQLRLEICNGGNLMLVI